MRTLILRFTAPYLAALMALFSVFVLLRGHNEPGGGFIGGLIAASAFAIYGIASGVGPVRRAIVFHPVSIAGAGLMMAVISGLFGILAGEEYLYGVWWFPTFLGTELHLSSILIFDIGVYLVVVGTITSIALGLEEKGRD